MNTRKNNKSLFIICAFAIISIISCKKEEGQKPVTTPETGTVTDIDGNMYKTIKIGEQWWMAENLKVTKYRDSTFLFEANILAGNDAWKNNTTGAYCAYSENSLITGMLYNWYAVNNSSNIAPEGWHLPSDAEWKQLESYLGMSSTDADKTGWRGTNEGEKLKIKAPEGWTSYETVWSTNESGFTALAGSCRVYNGMYGSPGIGFTGFWWTSSNYSSGEAWYRYLDYKTGNIFRSHCSKNYGYSIRCVKD